MRSGLIQGPRKYTLPLTRRKDKVPLQGDLDTDGKGREWKPEVASTLCPELAERTGERGADASSMGSSLLHSAEQERGPGGAEAATLWGAPCFCEFPRGLDAGAVWAELVAGGRWAAVASLEDLWERKRLEGDGSQQGTLVGAGWGWRGQDPEPSLHAALLFLMEGSRSKGPWGCGHQLSLPGPRAGWGSGAAGD